MYIALQVSYALWGHYNFSSGKIIYPYGHFPLHFVEVWEHDSGYGVVFTCGCYLRPSRQAMKWADNFSFYFFILGMYSVGKRWMLVRYLLALMHGEIFQFLYLNKYVA